MAHEQTISKPTYTRVFIALMVMLVLTVTVTFIPFDKLRLAWIGVTIAMTIAAIKAVLVVLFFMHVKVSSRLTKIFVVSGIFWLGILVGFTLSDYLTRGWLPYSADWEPKAVEHRP